jgi:hypothetical protein
LLPISFLGTRSQLWYIRVSGCATWVFSFLQGFWQVALVADCMCEKVAAKNTSSTLILLPLAIHKKTSVNIENLVDENGPISLYIYCNFILFFSIIPQNFVCNSHQTHLMREFWWHFTIN